MRGILTTLALAVALLVSLALYRLAYEGRKLERELVEIDRLLVDERQAIDVLRAEWSFLARPEAVQARALRHLDLAPLTARQVARFADLPARAARLNVESAALPRPRPRQSATQAETAERAP